MPWAMSAATVASAVVMRARASAEGRLGCFVLFMIFELRNGRAECADRRRAVESFGPGVMQRRVPSGLNLGPQAPD
jgi:hypothetical protein